MAARKKKKAKKRVAKRGKKKAKKRVAKRGKKKAGKKRGKKKAGKKAKKRGKKKAARRSSGPKITMAMIHDKLERIDRYVCQGPKRGCGGGSSVVASRAN